jgi:hypothetical protein
MKLSFTRSGIVRAPAESVWDIYSTFAQWPVWGPSTRGVVASADQVGIGVTGKVQTPIGVWLPFEITDVVVGEKWSWRVAGVITTTHTVEAVNINKTRIGFSVPIYVAPYALVCDRAIANIGKLAAAQ